MGTVSLGFDRIFCGLSMLLFYGGVGPHKPCYVSCLYKILQQAYLDHLEIHMYYLVRASTPMFLRHTFFRLLGGLLREAPLPQLFTEARVPDSQIHLDFQTTLCKTNLED